MGAETAKIPGYLPDPVRISPFPCPRRTPSRENVGFEPNHDTFEKGLDVNNAASYGAGRR